MSGRAAPFWPLAASTWDGAERRAAIAVIESGETTMGARVAAFEVRFAETVGARHAVMVNSGSSANLLAVACLFFTDPPRARAGAVAVVPAVSWATTYFPLAQYGLILRFVDVDAGTLNFDLAALERALDHDVAVVFAVNLLGNPNDFDAVRRLVEARGIALLEDNCESLGATWGGRAAGTFGAVGTFSTFFSHHISTMEGGVCVTDDEELHHILLALRAHGWTRDLPRSNRVAEPAQGGDFHELYRFVLPGYNLRPTEVAAAIGLEQLAKLPGFVAARRANAARFVAAMADVPGVRTQKELGESSWFGFALTLTGQATRSREEVVARLAADGVESRPIVAGNFTRQPVMARLRHEPPPPLPAADAVHERGFYIGNPHHEADDAIDRLAKIVQDAVG
ncbi:MAG: DegT/DnrJ/EryC1/StrS family aminotransferase [Caulobacteraceae bacterium]